MTVDKPTLQCHAAHKGSRATQAGSRLTHTRAQRCGHDTRAATKLLGRRPDQAACTLHATRHCHRCRRLCWWQCRLHKPLRLVRAHCRAAALGDLAPAHRVMSPVDMRRRSARSTATAADLKIPPPVFATPTPSDVLPPSCEPCVTHAGIHNDLSQPRNTAARPAAWLLAAVWLCRTQMCTPLPLACWAPALPVGCCEKLQTRLVMVPLASGPRTSMPGSACLQNTAAHETGLPAHLGRAPHIGSKHGSTSSSTPTARAGLRRLTHGCDFTTASMPALPRPATAAKLNVGEIKLAVQTARGRRTWLANASLGPTQKLLPACCS